MSNPHPVPGAVRVPDGSPIVTLCTIAWRDGTEAVARHEAYWSIQNANVVWTGSIDRLTDTPHRTDAITLRLICEQQAKATGGKLTTKQDGLWPAMDTVKAT